MAQMQTRAIKTYVADVDQKERDECARSQAFDVNTSRSRVRRDTPFYLIHGTDLRSTWKASLPLGSTKTRDLDPRKWRYIIQRQYQRESATVNERLKIAIRDQVDQNISDTDLHNIACGMQAWPIWIDLKKDTSAIWHTCGIVRFVWLRYGGLCGSFRYHRDAI